MSLKIKVYNKKAEAVKDLELNKKIFEVKVNNELLHQVVVGQMANARQVLADTKTKAEVSGGGKKPWKQKGTGRARAGSSRSPIWRGGGVTFGPSNERNFKKKINQKSKQKAMFMVLSERLAEGALVILDDLTFEKYKTKDFAQMISAIEAKVLETKRRDILIINGSKDERAFFSARNLKNVKIINPENINALELLNYRYLLLDEKTVKLLEETYC
ncbi:50S ribosomal protein L4 [Patescibacteria group bacterium]|nr:50S ribosomal protein L4 [Patescibacteria group bacterium]